MKKILLIAGDFSEDYETMVPFQALSMLGYQVDAVCPEKCAGEYIKTAIHDFEGDQTYTEKPGHLFQLNKSFDEVDIDSYDGMFITGGRSSEYLRLNENVLFMVRCFMQERKPIAAICHALQILAAADVIRGKSVTCYPAVAPEVKLAGAEYIAVPADQAIVCNNLVTAPAWPANTEILKQFIYLLEK